MCEKWLSFQSFSGRHFPKGCNNKPSLTHSTLYGRYSRMSAVNETEIFASSATKQVLWPTIKRYWCLCAHTHSLTLSEQMPLQNVSQPAATRPDILTQNDTKEADEKKHTLPTWGKPVLLAQS